MNTGLRHETAKIYQFPLKDRAPSRLLANNRPVAELKSQPVPEVEFGSGWYHDAAMHDADRTRKP